MHVMRYQKLTFHWSIKTCNCLKTHEIYVIWKFAFKVMNRGSVIKKFMTH